MAIIKFCLFLHKMSRASKAALEVEKEMKDEILTSGMSKQYYIPIYESKNIQTYGFNCEIGNYLVLQVFPVECDVESISLCENNEQSDKIDSKNKICIKTLNEGKNLFQKLPSLMMRKPQRSQFYKPIEINNEEQRSQAENCTKYCKLVITVISSKDIESGYRFIANKDDICIIPEHTFSLSKTLSEDDLGNADIKTLSTPEKPPRTNKLLNCRDKSDLEPLLQNQADTECKDRVHFVKRGSDVSKNENDILLGPDGCLRKQGNVLSI